MLIWVKIQLTSFSSRGNDSNNNPSSELELDDSESGDSELKSHTKSKAMNRDDEDNNMDIAEQDEKNDPSETYVQVCPAHDNTDKTSFSNFDGNEAIAIEPNTSDLQQDNIIGDSMSFSFLLWTRTHKKLTRMTKLHQFWPTRP